MTREFIESKMRYAIKQNGVNGYFVFFEDGIKLSNGTIVNEVRLKSKSLGVEFLEQGTNKVVKVGKKDLEKIYLNM